MTLKKINLIFLAFCGLVTLAVGGLLIFNFQTLGEVEQNVAARRAQAESLRQRVKEKQAFIDRFLVERNEFEQYLFSEKDVPAFLDGISSFAQQTQISVLDMQAEQFREVAVGVKAAKTDDSPVLKKKNPTVDPQNELTLAAMPIRFRVKGTFSDLLHFYGRLEGFKQLLSISDIEIRKQSEYPQLESSFKLQIYSFKTRHEL